MRVLPALLASLTICSCLLSQTVTEKPVRMVVQGKGINIPEGSFATKPKIIYRLGNKFARIEEEFNPETKIKALIISKAPDTWMINLADRTGRHIVDSDPNGNVVFPLFPDLAYPKDFPKEFSKLEFGFESQFFDSYKAPFTPFKTSKGELVRQYVGIGKWGVALAKTSEHGVPVFVFLMHNSEIDTAFFYSEYESITTPIANLFDPPTDAKIE